MLKQTYTQQKMTLTLIGEKEDIDYIANEKDERRCDDALDIACHEPQYLYTPTSEKSPIIIYKRDGYDFESQTCKDIIEGYPNAKPYVSVYPGSVKLSARKRKNERILKQMVQQLMKCYVLYNITFDFEPFIINGKLIRMSAKFEQKGHKITSTFIYDV